MFYLSFTLFYPLRKLQKNFHLRSRFPDQTSCWEKLDFKLFYLFRKRSHRMKKVKEPTRQAWYPLWRTRQVTYHANEPGPMNKMRSLRSWLSRWGPTSGNTWRRRWEIVRASNVANAGTTSWTHFFERLLGPLRRIGFSLFSRRPSRIAGQKSLMCSWGAATTR